MRIGERIGGDVPRERVVLAVIEQDRHRQVLPRPVGERGAAREPLLQPVEHALQVRRPLAEVPRRGLDVAVHQRAQGVEALALRGGDADHGHAESALERALVDAQPRGARGVHHVEHEQQRAPELDDLQRQVKVAVEVGGIDHEHDEVGRRRVVLQAEQDIAHDHLVGRRRLQAVAPRQVNDVGAVPRRQFAGAGLLLHRDAGIIADLLPQPGQRIEQRGLAGVRVAKDRNAPHRGVRHP